MEKRLRNCRTNSSSRRKKTIRSRSIALIFALISFSACREQVVHNLSEFDSTRMVTQLSGRGIAAFRDKQPDGRWTLSVDSSDTKEAFRLLDSRRLLRVERPALEDNNSMLASREEQRFRYERFLSREIEGTLAALDGVLDARVHLNLPPSDPLFGQPLSQSKGSASVLIIAGSDFKSQSSEIASIIGGASGIPLDNVSVLISISSSDDAAPASSQVSAPVPMPPIPRELPAGRFDMLWDERVLEGVISLLILTAGLLAMRRALRGRGRMKIHVGEAATGVPGEALL
jgi:type III secretion protein J